MLFIISNKRWFSLYIFNDDSGTLKPGSQGFFCSGLLLINNPHSSYREIRRIRNNHNFLNELHFHKISKRRALIYVDIINSIFNLEGSYFYGMLVNNENVSRNVLGRREYVGVNRVVKTLMKQCSMDFSQNTEATVFTDKKARVRQDNFTDYIRDISRRENYKIRIKEVIPLDSKDDDLIQVCDLITGAARTIFSGVNVESESRNFVLDNVRESLNNEDKVRIWNWEQV